MSGVRAPQSAIGVVLVITGLLVNPWLIGYLLADDQTIDSAALVSAILMVGLLLVLGGLQLWVRWVDRLARGHDVGVGRVIVVVTTVAMAIAGVYWRLSTYEAGHQHVMLVGSEHQHPTPEQEHWAEEFYQRSLAAARTHGWFDIDTAMAQGFQPDRINRTHFPNLEYMFDDVILDPDRPEWLVYADSPNGKVLMALMFFTRRLDETGPTPGGPLAQWHYHPYATPRCAIKGLWTVGAPDANGVCREGIPVTRTPEMLHVWFIDHPLGRFTEMQIIPEYWQETGFDWRRLHPIAVHFAIALFVIAALLDVAALLARRRDLHRAAWINLVCGAAAGVAAVTSGMTAEMMLTPTHEAHQTLDIHKLLAYISLGCILLLAGWRFVLRGEFPSRGAALYVALSMAGVAVITTAGYFGGEMVYTHGAAVRALNTFARERYWRQVSEVYRAGTSMSGDEVHELTPSPVHAGHR